MRILISYFSMTGHTAQLAPAIGHELEQRGHAVVFEEIFRENNISGFREILRDICSYPRAFTQVLFSSLEWKKEFFRTYHQVEEAIKTPEYMDVAEFDRVCIGGAKWVYLAYPVARYLKTIKGLEGKKVGGFTTFSGPPIKAFEIDMIEIPMSYAVRNRGGQFVGMAGITTAYHAAKIAPIFRLLSWLLFGTSIKNFMLGSEHSDRIIREFCDKIEA